MVKMLVLGKFSSGIYNIRLRAVGGNVNSTIYTSQDGVTWTARSTGLSNGLAMLAKNDNNTGFVVVDTYNGAAFSKDLKTWTVTKAADGVLNDVLSYANGNYIIIRRDSTTQYTSTDGINWSTSVRNTLLSVDTIIYTYGYYYAVSTSGSYNGIYRSSDLITWTKVVTAGTFTSGCNINLCNGMLIAGSQTYMCISTDGINWTNTAVTNPYVRSAVYFKGLYISQGSVYIYTSPDGITWTARSSVATQYMCCNNDICVAVGASGVILYSTDGITWTQATSGTTATLYKVSYYNNVFIATGASGVILYSTDGITWTQATSGTTDNLAYVNI